MTRRAAAGAGSFRVAAAAGAGPEQTSQNSVRRLWWILQAPARPAIDLPGPARAAGRTRSSRSTLSGTLEQHLLQLLVPNYWGNSSLVITYTI